jgi:cytidylate kinase
MPESLLIPSVDTRIGALEEYNRRQLSRVEMKEKGLKPQPAITISREFGCEAYPVAEKVCEIMKQQTGNEWLLMDNALIEAVCSQHNLSKEMLKNLGEKNRYLNEFLAAFSSNWGSQEDHFRLLSKFIISIASEGNAVIVGRGSAVVTQHLKNCYHFKLFAPMCFKTLSISRRLDLSSADAEKMIIKKQQLRDRFNKEFLNLDKHDLSYYDVLFNNSRVPTESIAESISDYVIKKHISI